MDADTFPPQIQPHAKMGKDPQDDQDLQCVKHCEMH